MAYSAIPLFVQSTILFCGLFRIQFSHHWTNHGTTSTSFSVKFMNAEESEDCLKTPHPTTEAIKTVVTAALLRTGKQITSKEPMIVKNVTKTVKNPAVDRNEDNKRAEEDSSCGPGKCIQGEVCVSWMKQSENILSPESPIVVHECLPNDGIHWNKMSPTGAKLCPDGKTHSILKENQNCLKEFPPCALTWRYVCVDWKDSPHSCKLRQCQSGGGCVEVIHCGLEPPCQKVATCIPKFLTDRP